jgi:hypothetical protein
MTLPHAAQRLQSIRSLGDVRQPGFLSSANGLRLDGGTTPARSPSKWESRQPLRRAAPPRLMPIEGRRARCTPPSGFARDSCARPVETEPAPTVGLIAPSASTSSGADGVERRHRASRLANHGIPWLTLAEALGQPPTVNQFGTSEFKLACVDLADDIDAAWEVYCDAVQRALTGSAVAQPNTPRAAPGQRAHDSADAAGPRAASRETVVMELEVAPPACRTTASRRRSAGAPARVAAAANRSLRASA